MKALVDQALCDFKEDSVGFRNPIARPTPLAMKSQLSNEGEQRTRGKTNSPSKATLTIEGTIHI